MTPVEALRFALQQEELAIDTYAKLSDEHPAIRELLLLLRNEEEKHKRLISQKIVELEK